MESLTGEQREDDGWEEISRAVFYQRVDMVHDMLCDQMADCEEQIEELRRFRDRTLMAEFHGRRVIYLQDPTTGQVFVRIRDKERMGFLK